VGTLRIDTTGLAPGTYDDIIALRPTDEAEIFSEPISTVALGATGEVEALTGTAGLVVTGSDTDTGGDDGSTDTPTDEPGDTTETDGVDGEPDPPTDDPDAPAGTGDDDGGDPVDPQDTTGDDGDSGDTIGTDDDTLPDSDDGVGDGEVVTGDAAADEDDPSVGPRVGGGFCGLGMLGSCLFILLGLATLKFCRSVRPL
jgi:hypothetical protein